jgi:hypothetical protein
MAKLLEGLRDLMQCGPVWGIEWALDPLGILNSGRVA